MFYEIDSTMHENGQGKEVFELVEVDGMEGMRRVVKRSTSIDFLAEMVKMMEEDHDI